MSDWYEPDDGPGRVDAIGGLARVAAGAWLKGASWSFGASVRVARATVDPRAAATLVQEVGDGLRNYAREVLGITILDERVKQLMPGSVDGRTTRVRERVSDGELLRARGEELLRQSADVSFEDRGHPAYARILEQLAPDEARILRLLALDGRQPAVDVRSSNLIGLGSEPIAEGLTMIGPQAGCRHPGLVHAYLNNLNRLGLIWFSKEPISDPVRYQVLEAQPSVLAAIKRRPRARTVQRSIELTPFGENFCNVCLPLGREQPAASASGGIRPTPAAGAAQDT